MSGLGTVGAQIMLAGNGFQVSSWEGNGAAPFCSNNASQCTDFWTPVRTLLPTGVVWEMRSRGRDFWASVLDWPFPKGHISQARHAREYGSQFCHKQDAMCQGHSQAPQPPALLTSSLVVRLEATR